MAERGSGSGAAYASVLVDALRALFDVSDGQRNEACRTRRLGTTSLVLTGLKLRFRVSSSGRGAVDPSALADDHLSIQA